VFLDSVDELDAGDDVLTRLGCTPDSVKDAMLRLATL